MSNNGDRETLLRAGRATGSGVSRSLMAVTAFAVVSGFLFGYDTSVISGALVLIARDFGNLGPVAKEAVVAVTTAGAALSSACGGTLADRFGRRAAIVGGAALFVAGSATLAAAPSLAVLLAGRFVVGAGIGVSSVAVPLLVAELAPPRYRGRLVSLQIVAVTSGQMVALLIDAAFLDVPGTWRWMLGLGALPALVQLLGARAVLPESPLFLAAQQRPRDALAVLRRVAASDADYRAARTDLRKQLRARQRAPRSLGALVSALRSPRVLPLLVLGVALQAAQQLSAINTVMYYSAEILLEAGFGSRDDPRMSIYLSCAVAGANAVFTLLALALIDLIGRRRLMLATLPGVVLALLALAFCFGAAHSDSTALSELPTAYLTLASLLVYIAFFATGMGVLPWAINSEIFPSHLSGAANGIATTTNWLCNLLVSATFLSIFIDYPVAGFCTYAAFAMMALVFFAVRLPETKGRSLLEIQREFLSSHRLDSDDGIGADEADDDVDDDADAALDDDAWLATIATTIAPP